MARKEKIPLGQKRNAPAQRQFTDREEPQESFKNALAHIHNNKHHILIFYGIGGIGKSSLKKHLQEKHLDNNKNAVYSWIDFELVDDHMPHNILRVLAKNFNSKYQVDFTFFNLAYLFYWEKAFPDQDIKKSILPFLEKGTKLAEAIDHLSDANGALKGTFKIVNYLYEKAKEDPFNKNIQNELKSLRGLEAHKIEEELVRYFEYDIHKFKKKNPTKKIVIFLDTYEALWQHNRSEANSLKQDEWIRDGLVQQLEHVLFVISGREKLQWEKDDSSWANDMEQHLLDNLSEEDAKSFLESCNIYNQAIQGKIIQSSEGLPYYLDLCVDTHNQITYNDKIPTVDDFSEVGKEKIFERFMRYLSLEEQETLKVLANAKFYNRKIFSLLIEEFQTGYPSTAINQLNNFSFIQKEGNLFFIHDLMRKSLISSQEQELRLEVNSVLFTYYNNKIENIEIKHITDETIEDFKEAFYHKEQLEDMQELLIWYSTMYKLFANASHYTTLLQTTMHLAKLFEEKLGLSNVFTATAYDYLGQLYKDLDNYPDAEIYYEKSLKIYEEKSSEREALIANVYNSLAILYRQTSQHKKVEPLYFKVLDIYTKIYGKEDIRTSIAHNNLAVYYDTIALYDQSEEQYLKALKIKEKVLGKDHENTALSYQNLAALYQILEKYDQVEELLEKTLKIYENTFGTESEFTASCYSAFAILYASQKLYEKAEASHIKSLDIKENIFGEHHTATANEYSNLAAYYKERELNHKVEPLIKKSLEIYKSVLGKEHPDTANSYNKLASYYESIENYDESETLYCKAIFIYETVFGERHPSTANAYNNLAALYMAKELHDKAETLYLKALRNNILVFGEEHSKVSTNYNYLGSFYFNKNNFEKAAYYFHKEIKVNEKIAKKDDPDTMFSYFNLAYIYHNHLGDTGEAIPLYKKALAAYTQSKNVNMICKLNGFLAKCYMYSDNNTLTRKHFQAYFDLMSFVDDVPLIEPVHSFISWYMFEENKHAKKNKKKLDALAKDLIVLYQNKLGDTYINELNHIYTTQILSLENSEDKSQKQTYKTFMKIFM